MNCIRMSLMTKLRMTEGYVFCEVGGAGTVMTTGSQKIFGIRNE